MGKAPASAACDFRIGERYALQLIVIPPFFEEANRTRRLIASVMRHLAEHSIGSRLIDLPGTGESLIDLATVTLADWRAAVASVAADYPRPPLTLAFRAGALLDDAFAAPAGWRLAPTDGAAVVRDLRRARLVGAATPDRFSGYRTGPALLDAIAAATPATVDRVRTVRLANDPAAADIHLPGAPLWRRAEPGDDPGLIDRLAQDILDWTRSCAVY